MTLSTISTLALAFTAFTGLANAHIKLNTPVPYGKDTLDTSPLKDAKPGTAGSDYPCKQRSGVYDVTERTQITAGADNTLSFDGSATHGGGSGFLAITTDEHPDVNTQWKTFMIYDSGMPVKGDSESGSGTSTYSYALPKGVPNGNLTMGWFWYNRIGNRELYHNCAPLEVTEGSDDQTVFNSLPNAYIINLPTSECSSQEMGDTVIPNPGNAVVVKGGGTSSLTATGPSCAASAAAVTKDVSGGPATGAASATSAPTSSASGSAGTSAPSSMTSVAASPSSTPSGGMIGSSAYGSAPASFLTISTAAASSPASSSAYPTMKPSSAGIAALSGYPAATRGASPTGSSSGSFGGSTGSGGMTCSSDGKQFCVDVNGSSVCRDVAAGTTCQNGQIVKRSLLRHAHIRRAGHV